MSAPPIRMPEERDQAEWLRLRRALWPDCAPDQHELEMGTVLADADRAAVFVSPASSSQDERLAGFVELALRPWYEGCPGSPVAYVEALFVTPEERGRGVGAALLAAFEAAVASRSRHAFLLVSDFNRPAQAFYRRHGYAEVGRLPALVVPGIDELVYWKRLR